MIDTSNIELPRKDENGEYYISYSQFSSWKSMSSFNLKTLGTIEYIASYFLKRDWPDMGWAEFGQDVEDYVCERKQAHMFLPKEKETLHRITPLGNFQIKVKLYILPGVYILGFIDDGTHDLSKIRDYKTASANSKARYYQPDYKQLDIYALWVYDQTNVIPEMEVCIIERKGNCYGMVNRRDLLTVGEEIWYVPRETNLVKMELIREELISTIVDISNHFKLFQKFNN